MDRGRQLPRVTAGFWPVALAAILSVAAGVLPLHAQTQLTTPSTGIGPFQTSVKQPQPPRRAPPTVPADLDDAPLPRLPAPPQDGDPSTEPGAETADDDAPPLPRRAIGETDPTWAPEPSAPVDGVLPKADDEPVYDDGKPAAGDGRRPEDVAAFERPRVGFDPEAFSIEVDPILDRRPASLYRFEPFQATGYKVGQFIVLPEVVVAGAGYSNLFRSASNAQRDATLELRPTFRAVSDWRVHAMEVRATGFGSFHTDHPGEDDRAYQLEARGRIDVTRRTNIEVLTSYEVGQESRGSINAASALGERADIATSRASIAFNHRFNRLSVQLRGSLVETDVSPSTTDTGAFVSNRERDNSVREGGMRLAWELKPALSVFTEVLANTREYAAPSLDGISRNSTGDRTRVGLSFGNSGQIVRGEVSAGYGRQRFEDGRLPEIDGVLLDANLAWRISGLTALLVNARTDVTESQVGGAGGALTRTGSVELRHELGRRLIGTAGVRLTKQDYEGSSIGEREVAGLLGLEYYLNREVTLFGRFQHVDFESTVAGRGYDADEARVGVRIRH